VDSRQYQRTRRIAVTEFHHFRRGVSFVRKDKRFTVLTAMRPPIVDFGLNTVFFFPRFRVQPQVQPKLCWLDYCHPLPSLPLRASYANLPPHECFRCIRSGMQGIRHIHKNELNTLSFFQNAPIQRSGTLISMPNESSFDRVLPSCSVTSHWIRRSRHRFSLLLHVLIIFALRFFNVPPCPFGRIVVWVVLVFLVFATLQANSDWSVLWLQQFF
jgi:hypothetical protein